LEKKHVHFMGIGGSALAGVAILAKKAGFKVSGCDLEKETAYSASLSKFKIKPLVGHDESHLKGVDLVAVSPALLFQQPLSTELVEAERRGLLLTWQEFQGRFLQKDKMVIAVAGTHGKSTITAMIGLLLMKGGLDPTVEVGALVPQWGATARFGRSQFFVCEADEFNYNFLNYSPAVIIINNLEMDHPEFFKDFPQFLEAFVKFIQKIKPPKIFIVNEESVGIQLLLKKMRNWLSKEKVKTIGVFLEKNFPYPFSAEYQGSVLAQKPSLTKFLLKKDETQEEFVLKVPGSHQVQNALVALACGFELGIAPVKMKQALVDFQGVGRRFELVGEERGVKVYDDYAVHPTAIVATLKAAHQQYPGQKIWAVFEPHQFSRLKLFLSDFVQALSLADQVVVTAIFQGREKNNHLVKAEQLVGLLGEKAFYEPDFQTLAEKVSQKVKKGDVIIVFGAGKSYQLSRQILKKLNDKES